MGQNGGRGNGGFDTRSPCWDSERLGWNPFGGLPDDVDGLKMGLEWNILTVCIVWLETLKKKIEKNLKNKNRRHIYEILAGFGRELLGGSSGAAELELELRESVWCFFWPKSTNLIYNDAPLLSKILDLRQRWLLGKQFLFIIHFWKGEAES